MLSGGNAYSHVSSTYCLAVGGSQGASGPCIRRRFDVGLVCLPCFQRVLSNPVRHHIGPKPCYRGMGVSVSPLIA